MGSGIREEMLKFTVYFTLEQQLCTEKRSMLSNIEVLIEEINSSHTYIHVLSAHIRKTRKTYPHKKNKRNIENQCIDVKNKVNLYMVDEERS